MRRAFKDLVKLSVNHGGRIPKLIDEHYLFWCYSYHREGKHNPMSIDRWKRDNVIYMSGTNDTPN